MEHPEAILEPCDGAPMRLLSILDAIMLRDGCHNSFDEPTSRVLSKLLVRAFDFGSIGHDLVSECSMGGNISREARDIVHDHHTVLYSCCAKKCQQLVHARTFSNATGDNIRKYLDDFVVLPSGIFSASSLLA
ncbi:MAG: hypothetical protein V7684_01825 [Loktanella salsilacus]